jgi:hypothetical protein
MRYSNLGKSGHRAPHWRLAHRANYLSLNQGKLPIFFSLAVSCQQRSIVFPLPLGFLQKISLPPKADIRRFNRNVRFVPCVDGSESARTFFTFAALVGAAMCSAC